MSIAWNVFTPWSALLGGMVIGLAAAMFVLLNGRIAGISGVLGGLLKPVRGDVLWRAAFVLGLVGTPLVYGLFTALPAIQVDAGYGALAAAGLLVGIGTRFGGGLVATATFMAAGFATVFVARHLFNI